MHLLEAEHIKKIYSSRFSMQRVEALKDISFTVDPGEFIAVMGESGSGKTTLLNILATLDQPTAGSLKLSGENLCALKGKKLSSFRRDHMGFVFQDFHLLDTFSCRDNILLPMVLSNKKYEEMQKELKPLAESLAISDILDQSICEVSGGQKQRCAIARALIMHPQIILADEPTGALDSKSSEEVLHIFDQLSSAGQTIVMVTHSINAASHASRVLFIADGTLYHQIYRGEKTEDEMYEAISSVLTFMRGKKYV